MKKQLFNKIWMKEITSIQNTFIKQLVKLQDKSRERKKTGLFVVEGLREIALAASSNYHIEHILFFPELISHTELTEILPHPDEIDFIAISENIYKKIAYRDGTEGVVAIVQSKDHSLSMLNITTKNPLFLIAEAPEKPGNIGAILRTADAANVDAVIIANPRTDIYNSNSIRSSVGGVFTNTIVEGNTSEIIDFLKENNINTYAAALTENAVCYSKQDFTKPTAIVVGTEATGLSDEWLQNVDKTIIIPMLGSIDSMNVSVAAGILIFEAVRQRMGK